MVDVGGKRVTARKAVATGRVRMRQETLHRILEGRIPKGPAIEVATVAGIQAAKKVPDLIPLCHPLPIDAIHIEMEPAPGPSIRIRAEVKTRSRTGAEMEALTAVSVAALTLYDMCKSAEKGIEIGEIALESKSGGKGGAYRRRV